MLKTQKAFNDGFATTELNLKFLMSVLKTLARKQLKNRISNIELLKHQQKIY